MVITQRTINANKDEIEDPDIKSQDEGDMGYRARPGGGFTFVVNV